MPSFIEKLGGAVYGTAIGDGMGAPVEGWSPAKIAERFPNHDFSTFLPPTHNGNPDGGKGNGRITDDTLMMEALIRAYNGCSTHTDAYAFRDCFMPEFTERPVWIPERREETILLERLNQLEKTRQAFLAFDPTVDRGGGAFFNQPSSGLSIEEVPVALAVMKYGAGDFLRTITAAVRYGRDCDSIAGMACGLAGALFGSEAEQRGMPVQTITAACFATPA